MAASCQSVEETVSGILARRPVLSPVLQAFAPLLAARAALPEQLKPLLESAGIRLPEMQRERAAQGYPLLAEMSLAGIGTALRTAAETLIPLLAAQDVVRPHEAKLRAFFLDAAQGPEAPVALAEAVLNETAESAESVGKIAAHLDIPVQVLLFAFSFMLGPVLRALVELSPHGNGKEAPWNVEGAWRQGYCPVCGSGPSIAYLDRPVFDEKNAFLAGGGGKKHLHCSLCGTDWTFRRGACPFCGEEGAGVMEILKEAGNALGERLDWCTRCKTYCPAVDLRERDTTPDLDVLALGMLHMDMVAAKKACSPSIPLSGTRFSTSCRGCLAASGHYEVTHETSAHCDMYAVIDRRRGHLGRGWRRQGSGQAHRAQELGA